MKAFHFLLILAVVVVSCDKSCDNTSEPVVEPIPDWLPHAEQIYPENNSTGQSRSPVFIWHGRIDPEEVVDYEFTLHVTDSMFNVVATIVSDKDTVVQYPDTLEAETKYVWQVSTRSQGKETLSRICYFTTGSGFNNPPSSAYDACPPDSAADITLDAPLSWSAFDPDGDDITYDIWYRPDKGVRTDVAGLTEPKFTVPLDADTRYSWHVTVLDEHGASAPWVDYCVFNTISTSPPHNPFPADGATGVPADVPLRWTCSDPDGDALTYEVYMGPAGVGLQMIGSGLSEDFLAVTGLAYDTEYDWNVVAEDDDGHRTCGPVWSFTTGTLRGVYAELVVHRSQSFNGIELTRVDHISARFDSVYAPDGPVNPLQPEAVCCGQPIPGCVFDLVWQSSSNRYYYHNPVAGNFLAPGVEYFFGITGADGVPSFVTDPILYLECRPYITSPEGFSFVTLEGLEVVWVNYDLYPDCDRPVTIRIFDLNASWTPVFVTTENDGSYTFSASDLAGLSPSAYQLQIVLIVDSRESIVAAGYDPRSFIETSTWATQTVYRNP